MGGRMPVESAGYDTLAFEAGYQTGERPSTIPAHQWSGAYVDAQWLSHERPCGAVQLHSTRIQGIVQQYDPLTASVCKAV